MKNALGPGLALLVLVAFGASASTPSSPPPASYAATSVFRDGNLACRFVPVPRAPYHTASVSVASKPSAGRLPLPPSSAPSGTVYERHCWQVAD